MRSSCSSRSSLSDIFREKIADFSDEDTGSRRYKLREVPFTKISIPGRRVHFATINSPSHDWHGPESLDAKPWIWSSDLSEKDIYFITVAFSGTKLTGIGLAFNNFSPSESAAVVPIPGSFWLLASGLFPLIARERKRRKKIQRHSDFGEIVSKVDFFSPIWNKAITADD